MKIVLYSESYTNFTYTKFFSLFFFLFLHELPIILCFPSNPNDYFTHNSTSYGQKFQYFIQSERMSRHYVIPQASGISMAQTPFSSTPSRQAQAQSIQMQSNLLFPWENPRLFTQESQTGFTNFPIYMRSVTSVFPASYNVYSQMKIPLGIVIQPAISMECPIIDYSNGNVPRCQKCSSYLCPQAQVVSDRQWKCPLCGNVNNADEYFLGSLRDSKELQLPVYDILAPISKYFHIDPHPTFMFLIDTSLPAYNVGLPQNFLNLLLSLVDSIPEYYYVSLMTMSNKITVFDLVNETEIVIADLTEVPNMSQYQKYTVVKLADFKEQFKAAIKQIIETPPNLSSCGHCFGSALQVAEALLLNNGGILISALTGFPKHGPHTLRERYNDDELTMLRLPGDGSGKIFRDMAFRLNRASVSVHLFAVGESFMDFSVIAIPTGLTCGQIHHYRILSQAECEQMNADLYATLTNQYCWDSCFRLRTSSGIKLVKPHTNCTLRANGLISFPVIGKEESIAFELALTEDKEIKSPTVLFQFSMVYNDNASRRMIRVFTIEAPVSNDIFQLFNSVDEATLVTLIQRRAVTQLLQLGPQNAVDSIKKEIATISAQKSIHFSSFHHLIHSLLCNPAFRIRLNGGVDARMAKLIRLRAISINDLILYLYPIMYSVDTGSILPLTNESFQYGTIFLIHTFDAIIIWISSNIAPEFLQNTFGVNSRESINQVPQLQTQENQALHNLLNQCYNYSGRYLPLEIISQGELPQDILVDDLAECGSNLRQWLQTYVFGM